MIYLSKMRKKLSKNGNEYFVGRFNVDSFVYLFKDRDSDTYSLRLKKKDVDTRQEDATMKE